MTEDEIITIVDNITEINNNYEPSFYKMVVRRLFDFGYKLTKDDYWCFLFSIDKTVNKIKAACNIIDIPIKLFEIITDRIIGEFLFMKKQSNQLEMDNFDLETAVKAIKLGDTDVTFRDDAESDEIKLNSLISYLMSYGEKEILCYRKLKW